MAYTIGVSSGYWSIKKDVSLLGFDRKIQWSATAGVRFTQVDIESINELQEPDLKNKVERTKKLGITFGCHAEAKAIGMDTLPLDSAIESDYFRAHDRLIRHIKGCGEIGSLYINAHASESMPFLLLWRDLQPTTLVDIWGRKFSKFLDDNNDLCKWAIKCNYIQEVGHWWQYARNDAFNKLEALKKSQKKELTKEEEEKLAENFVIDYFKEYFTSGDQIYGSERVAYFITAKWMMNRKDPLWMNIVGKIISDDDLPKQDFLQKWVPAVSAKYIWGHFNPLKNFGYDDPKTLLEKYKVYWLFETSMGEKGHELYVRLGKLAHMYYLARAIGSKWVGYTMDMEHMMGCHLDPEKEIKELPSIGGEYLKLVHVTVPTSHNPSHLPIYMASEAQLYIYERLFDLRKKGFKEGWMIFERGGEEGEIKQSTLSMRKIKEFLEKDVPPKELPLEFFGMKPEGPELSRQRVAIEEHKLDPLKGMMQVSEEEHDFLGRAARDKGKLEEWKKERYR